MCVGSPVFTVRPEISQVLQPFDINNPIPHYSLLYQPSTEDKREITPVFFFCCCYPQLSKTLDLMLFFPFHCVLFEPWVTQLCISCQSFSSNGTSNCNCLTSDEGVEKKACVGNTSGYKSAFSYNSCWRIWFVLQRKVILKIDICNIQRNMHK